MKVCKGLPVEVPRQPLLQQPPPGGKDSLAVPISPTCRRSHAIRLLKSTSTWIPSKIQQQIQKSSMPYGFPGTVLLASAKRATFIIKQFFSTQHVDHERMRPWIGTAAAAEPWHSAAQAGFWFFAPLPNMLQTCVSIGCIQGSAAASRLVALLAGTPPQEQHRQWQHWHCRSVWNDSIDQREARKADSFYDSTIERVSACWAAALYDGLGGGCTRNTHALPPPHPCAAATACCCAAVC